MKKALLALILVGLTAAGARADEDLLKAYREASPTRRMAARQLLHQKYPELPEQLAQHLQSRYPQLQVRAGNALLSLDQKYPGLVFSLPRHLLEDLGGEPARAALDVKQAVGARYPNFPTRIRELRRQHFPVEKPEEVREAVFAMLAEKHPDAGLAMRSEAIAVLREKYPGLMWKALAYRGRMLQHADLFRPALVDVLKRLEQTHAHTPARMARDVLDLVATRYPDLPAQSWAKRRAARRAMRDAVLSEFPELPSIVARTLEEKHPQLLGQALASVDRHYPSLRSDVRAALERELPGLESEIRGFVQTRYPDLESDLDAALKG